MIIVGEKIIAHKIVLKTMRNYLKSSFVDGTFSRVTVILLWANISFRHFSMVFKIYVVGYTFPQGSIKVNSTRSLWAKMVFSSSEQISKYEHI